MFSHVMVGTNDIEESKRFYDAVLAVIGAGEAIRNAAKTGHQRLFYRHDGSTFWVSEPTNDRAACCANGGTIGFKCKSPPSRCASFTTRRWRCAVYRGA